MLGYSIISHVTYVELIVDFADLRQFLHSFFYQLSLKNFYHVSLKNFDTFNRVSCTFIIFSLPKEELF